MKWGMKGSNISGMQLHIQIVCWRISSELCTCKTASFVASTIWCVPHLNMFAFVSCSVEMTGLTDACVKDLCTAVRASRTLKNLELRNNLLTDESVPALIKVMQESPNMVELW